MVDLESDVKFPTRAENWIETLVIGTLLTLFSVFFVPILPVFGYLVHTARAGMAGVEEPISFTEWETLFVDGLKGMVVVVVYQLPPALVGIFSFVALIGLGSGNDTLAGASLLIFLLGVLAASVLALVFGYLGVVGVLAFASEDRLGGAFDINQVTSTALDGTFAIQWLYGVALLFGANVLFGVVLFTLNLVMIIPIIGFIIALLALLVVGPVGAAFSFYAQIVVFTVWGRGYGDARDLDRGDVPDWVGRESVPSERIESSVTAADSGHRAALSPDSERDASTTAADDEEDQEDEIRNGENRDEEDRNGENRDA